MWLSITIPMPEKMNTPELTTIPEKKERTTTNTYIMKFILPFFVSKVGDRNASCQYVILSQSKLGMWVYVVMVRVGVFGSSKLEVEAIASQYVNRRKR